MTFSRSVIYLLVLGGVIGCVSLDPNIERPRRTELSCSRLDEISFRHAETGGGADELSMIVRGVYVWPKDAIRSEGTLVEAIALVESPVVRTDEGWTYLPIGTTEFPENGEWRPYLALEFTMEGSEVMHQAGLEIERRRDSGPHASPTLLLEMGGEILFIATSHHVDKPQTELFLGPMLRFDMASLRDFVSRKLDCRGGSN